MKIKIDLLHEDDFLRLIEKCPRAIKAVEKKAERFYTIYLSDKAYISAKSEFDTICVSYDDVCVIPVDHFVEVTIM